jgi:hypothetical protein
MPEVYHPEKPMKPSRQNVGDNRPPDAQIGE